MAETIQPILDTLLLNNGYDVEWYWGDYNQYKQEILDLNSKLYEFKPNLILLLTRINETIPTFYTDYGNYNYDYWLEKSNDTINEINTLIETIHSNPILRL